MPPDRVCVAADPRSGLEGTLTILRGGDGGASAVDVELRNPADGHEVALQVNNETSAFIMLTVTDQQGTVLSEPARRFDSSETQRFSAVRMERGSSRRWRVPIAAQLRPSAVPEQGMTGRLVVNVALAFNRVRGSEQPADVGPELSVLTLYHMEVLFTRAALREGAKPLTADS